MKINLAIVQPVGYVHALGFLEQARYFRYQFRLMGHDVTITKNRLMRSSLNFIFGAHVGVDYEWLSGHMYVIVNLEQLVDGGLDVSREYIELLKNSSVIDYHEPNTKVYAADRGVPIIRHLYAPYLAQANPKSLEDRPIDLLFMGAMTPSRRWTFDWIKKAGYNIVHSPVLFGPERDSLLADAKAVLNIHAYQSAVFEQTRASFVLSNYVPFIHIETPGEHIPSEIRPSVFTMFENELSQFLEEEFKTPVWYARSRQMLDRFKTTNPAHDYFEPMFESVFADVKRAGETKKTRINIGSGKDYKPGWINVDINPAAEPDWLIDLSKDEIPAVMAGASLGAQSIELGSFTEIYASNVLEHVADLPKFMTNCLALLKEGGSMYIEVPYDGSPQAWQDPTHVRAVNQNSWQYYTHWFWYLGWFEHRFELRNLRYLDENMQPYPSPWIALPPPSFMSLNLVKVMTTPEERTTARTYQQNFGGIPNDIVKSGNGE